MSVLWKRRTEEDEGCEAEDLGVFIYDVFCLEVCHWTLRGVESLEFIIVDYLTFKTSLVTF